MRDRYPSTVTRYRGRRCVVRPLPAVRPLPQVGLARDRYPLTAARYRTAVDARYAPAGAGEPGAGPLFVTAGAGPLFVTAVNTRCAAVTRYAAVTRRPPAGAGEPGA